MKKLYNRITAFYNTIKSKIAFYPTLLSLGGFLVALLMILLEKEGISRKLIEIFPLIVIEDGDTALNVLSTCIGGLISLMVFSFSMVMLLLSQASSNFSPRLLPGLISNKKHQLILGFYLATIIYNIFTLFSIEPSEKKYTLPGLSILIGVLLTIICLSAFIFFIHNISQSIQINNIMDGIYDKASKRMEEVIKKEKENPTAVVESFPDTEGWTAYISPKTGYFQNLAEKNIMDICEKQETKIHITVPKGLFVLKNVPILKSEKALSQEVIKDIFQNLNFARGEYIEDNYVLSFKQICEIALKAMSPGINDPGTAINAIDYLTELFALRLQKSDSGVLVFDGKAKIRIAVVSFSELLYYVMSSLRTYCKHDPIVVQKLLWMLSYLKQQPCEVDSYNESIEREISVLMKDVNFDSPTDQRKVEELATSLGDGSFGENN
ncbi:DUF2254 domain-containing protein [Nonlabens antarcticus]|uniref:DUF2254 domain-containing protein n=1 Tax=Nonlabens antarcticus TaxID=392714 RepID=UPI001891919A|nr:DUF2254 domain-containing protein [Nonlabens antarcticus]